MQLHGVHCAALLQVRRVRHSPGTGRFCLEPELTFQSIDKSFWNRKVGMDGSEHDFDYSKQLVKHYQHQLITFNTTLSTGTVYR